MDIWRAGDEITDVGMNIQPVLLLAALAFLVLGMIPLLRVFWAVGRLNAFGNYSLLSLFSGEDIRQIQ